MASEHLIEPIPETKTNQQFPYGDITFPTLRAEEIIQRMSGDFETARPIISNMISQGKTLWYAHIFNKGISEESTDDLFNSWGQSLFPNPQYGSKMIRSGFFSSISFAHNGRLLPPIHKDQEDLLFNLSEKTGDEIGFFSEQAWTTMHVSHPNIYTYFSQLSFLLSNFFNQLFEQDVATVIEPVVVLPYILSSGSRLAGYAKRKLQANPMIVATLFPTNTEPD